MNRLQTNTYISFVESVTKINLQSHTYARSAFATGDVMHITHLVMHHMVIEKKFHAVMQGDLHCQSNHTEFSLQVMQHHSVNHMPHTTHICSTYYNTTLIL